MAGSRAQRQRVNPATMERRRRVLAALVAVYDHMKSTGLSAVPPAVKAFHVRFFGLPECVTTLDLAMIRRDLGWLRENEYVERIGGGEFVPTDKGREWIA